jgi:predicted nucleotide-binding protein (sugar kinase/HSP70/actin superfamily)
MKFAIYQVGDSAIATNAFARKIGIELVTLPYPNKETISTGVLYAPEFSCFPFKVLLGSLLQALNKGVEVFIVPKSKTVAACQLADFGMAQKYILEKTGKKFDTIFLESLNPGNIVKKFKVYNPEITLKKVTEGLFAAAQKLSLMEEMESLYRQIYVSSKKKKAEMFRNKWIKTIDKTDSIVELYMLNKRMYDDFRKYPAIDMKNVLKIAVIGDIYTINEPFINNNIFERLCDLEVYSEKGISLNAFAGIKLGINPEEIMLNNQAKKYLRHNVGAFSQDTIKSAIHYSEKGFDGIIHIYPFSCMPEITVRNILPKVSSDYNIPILYLPIDEQTGDAGFTTRIEAFVDLINIRKTKNNFSTNK